MYVNLFVTSTSTITLDKKHPVTISQETQYPWDGKIAMTVSPEKESRFTLHLRIPGWAKDQVTPGDLYSFIDQEKDSVAILVNGEAVAYTTEKGYALINRSWQKGDVVTYHLPMSVRRVRSNALVAENKGKVALVFGPIVYCLEGADNGPEVLKMALADTSKLQAAYTPGFLNGVVTISGPALLCDGAKDQSRPMVAIPYYAWNNRGANEMKVWIAVKE